MLRKEHHTNTRGDRRDDLLIAAAGALPAVWIALKIAPYWNRSIFDLFTRMDEVLSEPWHIEWTDGSLKAVLFCLFAYAMGVGIWFSTRRNYRRGEEHGSAKWGDARTVNRKYHQKPDENNKILTQNVSIGFDGHKHRRNLNIMVVGGSGAGKTRGYVLPNVLNCASPSCNCSMVILDPKSEILKATGEYLKAQGNIEIKVLNLQDPQHSHCYNPFVYLRDDNDVQRLVTNLFKATTPKGATSQDPFWDTSAQMLLMALVLYLKYEAPEDEQNFAMVMDMIRAGEVDEEDSKMPSALDNLFYDLRRTDPGHIALKYYDAYHSGAAKTLKSIQITLAARLEKFNLESIAKLTITDELDLWSLGEKKTALFAIIPDNDTSFNFLISILYTQLFQQLFELADKKYGGSLPVHVQFLCDEFANIAMPESFQQILSVMRSRGVSVSIILQNMAQLKALFEKDWESVTGNCDEFVYLGGNEQSTHKYVSELLGKETIDTTTYGKSTGRNGNYTTNFNNAGRELMTADEVRMLDNRYALLFIRGERPVMDLKYDVTKHPSGGLASADGKYRPYRFGEEDESSYSIELVYNPELIMQATQNAADIIELGDSDYVLLSEEDIEKEIRNNKQE